MTVVRESLLLRALPESERYRLVRTMEPVDLPGHFIFYEQGMPLSHVFFITSGVSSLIVTATNGSGVEAALIGNEGLVGLPAFLELDRSLGKVAQQIPGTALRMTVRDFREAASSCVALRSALLRFTGLVLSQAMQAAACNRLHTGEQRCARWLLLCGDRTGHEEFPMTQDFIAQMVGSSRPAVSEILRELERAGIIHHSRGRVSIVRRDELMRRACECYDVQCSAYRQFVDSLIAA